MQKARSQRSLRPKTEPLLLPLVGTWFQGLFHSPPGVLFTFPSRYWFAIGHRFVFRLGRWSCQLQSGFLVSRLTQGRRPAARVTFAYRALTLYGGAFQRASARSLPSAEDPAGSSNTALQPRENNGCSLLRPHGLGSSPVARRYWGNHSCFLLLRVLRCFSSPGSPRRAIYSPHDDRASPRPGCPIRIPMDLRSLAAPHGFSQLATSFLAVLCPGIHPAPLFA